MALIDDLIAAAGDADVPVREITSGPDWIMVTASGSGVASRTSPALENKADRETPDLSPAQIAGRFTNRPLADLLGLASSSEHLEASLGVAALNSALSAGQPAARARSSAIPRAGGKTVVTIGRFAFIEDLRRVADRVITVGEDTPDESLAGADVAIIRASALIDGTLESWLARTSHCYTVVYGPSTPLSPVLFEYGADQLVGVSIGIADVAAGWIREGRDALLTCPGVKPVVIGRDQQSR